jgi:hypothetical protein
MHKNIIIRLLIKIFRKRYLHKFNIKIEYLNLVQKLTDILKILAKIYKRVRKQLSEAQQMQNKMVNKLTTNIYKIP